MGRMMSPAPLFAAHLPIEKLTHGDGRFTSATVFTEEHLNNGGAVHGGFIAAILDVALAAGGSAASDDPDAYGITISITVNFVQPLGLGRASVESQTVGGGRTTKFVEAKLRDETGEICATASGTVRVTVLAAQSSG